jgi:hypothetical protein
MKEPYRAGCSISDCRNTKNLYTVRTNNGRTLSALADEAEHGVTGDVLSVMDNASLTDLGVASVGHRLNLLRAVWELKVEQGLEIGEEDWTPQGKIRYGTRVNRPPD